MGSLLKTKSNLSQSKAAKSNPAHNSFVQTQEIPLYKPISEFDWKDATKSEIKKTAIRAYKKLAF
jgi:hypothetical protein